MEAQSDRGEYGGSVTRLSGTGEYGCSKWHTCQVEKSMGTYK